MERQTVTSEQVDCPESRAEPLLVEAARSARGGSEMPTIEELFAECGPDFWRKIGSDDPADWPEYIRRVYEDNRRRMRFDVSLDIEQVDLLPDYVGNILEEEALEAAQPDVGRLVAILEVLDHVMPRGSVAEKLLDQASEDVHAVIIKVARRLQVVAPCAAKLLPYRSGYELWCAVRRELGEEPPQVEPEAEEAA